MAYLLALIVGLGSFGLYMAAFFFPEVHRKFDFIWSGIGMFYALVLWVCAGRITGAVLLGQTASVALLGWFVWQAINLRRALVPENLRTLADQPEQTMGGIIQEQWARSQTYLNQRFQRILSGVAEKSADDEAIAPQNATELLKELELEQTVKQPLVPIPLSDIRPTRIQPSSLESTETAQTSQPPGKRSHSKSMRTALPRSPHSVATVTQRVRQILTGSPQSALTPISVNASKNFSRSSQRRSSVKKQAAIDAELVTDEELQEDDLVQLNAELELSDSTRPTLRRTKSLQAKVETPETVAIEMMEPVPELMEPEIAMHSSAGSSIAESSPQDDSEDWF
jgi:hypothetical protein